MNMNAFFLFHRDLYNKNFQENAKDLPLKIRLAYYTGKRELLSVFSSIVNVCCVFDELKIFLK